MLRRIYNLLSHRQRKKSIWIVLSVLLRSILDFAGIAALVPVIFVIADRLENERRLVLLLCAGVVILVIVKNLLILLLAKWQVRFQLNIFRDFSRRMFINLYGRGLMFLRKNSGVQLSYEVNWVSLTFSTSVLGALFRMAGEGFLVIIMAVALIVWKPMMGLFTILLFIPMSAIYARGVRKRVRELGEENLKAYRTQSRTVAEAFRGYADLEIANAFDDSLKSFDHTMEKIILNRRQMDIYQLFPFFLSEMSIVAGLLILAAFGGNDLVVTGGVFAIAAFRMIPAIRGVLNNYATLQNSATSIEVVEKGLENENEKPELIQDDSPLTFNKGLKAVNLAFSFPDGKHLFGPVNFEIRKGERVGIRGKSGAGKSTLFNILLGFFAPTQGKILIDGVELTEANRLSWHKIVGYVPQEIFIIDGSLAQNIALGREIDTVKIEQVLRQVQLYDWARDLENGLDTNLGEYGSRLSGGQKQRIGIARALYKDAEVLFLDEATSALDSDTEREINSTLAELSVLHRELTMIVITHRETSLSICDRILDLDNDMMTDNPK